MRVTATKLRANLFKLLGCVIERGGQLLRLSLAKPGIRLANLVSRPTFVKGDPDDLVHMDWSNEWKPSRPRPESIRGRAIHLIALLSQALK